MKKIRMIYSLLIISFITALGFSIYFYEHVQTINQEMEEVYSPEAPLPKYHFVLIVEEMEHEYWQLIGEGAKNAGQKYGAAVEYIGPERSNTEEQLKLFDKAIKSKVDGIIVQGLNEHFTDMINKAERQNIPVVTIDTDSPESMRHAYIGSDNYMAGQLAGKALVEDTNGVANVGIITGSLDNPHHLERVEGFKDVVEQVEGIEIVAVEESKITRVEVEEKAYNILTEHENITAFFGTSSYNGIGIVSAANSLQKQNDMYVITFDTIDENMELLKNGEIEAIVEQHPFEMGYLSVERMVDIMNGKQFKEITHTNSSIINKSTLDLEKETMVVPYDKN
ncbi:sugar-binding protein [Fredinandcohnia onubensis]|uniref:sugar-binding protein n=1 Tax=Fredinandcohnia onubensis TaxID=1571209 RepID=UPI000C0C0487|nr:sugar-binding protein [Fredinandcohnia onubensis]